VLPDWAPAVPGKAKMANSGAPNTRCLCIIRRFPMRSVPATNLSANGRRTAARFAGLAAIVKRCALGPLDWCRRVGKGAFALCPPSLDTVMRGGGHAVLCPPYDPSRCNYFIPMQFA
jgi:hypothetical protein